MNSTDLRERFDVQYGASREQVSVPLMVRRERVLRMGKMLDEHAGTLAAAIEADFGVRSKRLTEVADLFVLHTLIAHTLKNLARWSRPKKVRTPLYLLPASARIERQPLGVVGVIAPWNYPVQLALAPAITALAAGNRVMIKPSELTPHTSAQLARLLAQFFTPEEVCVVQGDAAVASAFAALPFDHLVFTGSTAVGRKVAQAAAVNLTPTTLELGGKSPCIVDADCRLEDAALKIAHGKLLNAGQTCIAPDYVLLPRGSESAFADAYKAAVAKLFPRIAGNADYASIISPRHLARLRTMLQQAQTQGAQVLSMDPAPGASTAPRAATLDGATSRQMPPTLVLGATSAMQLMQEEIFGPILPVILYDRLDDAIGLINSGPRPLALYWFGNSDSVRDDVLARTVSGGVSVNDTLMHIAHDNLPFGGVGDSGWGAYHGEQGFLRLSHQKSVLIQSRWSLGSMLYPPYGKRLDGVLKLLRRLM